MHRHRRLGLLTSFPEDIPVPGIETREAELGRVFAESDRVTALRGATANFGRCQLRIPEWNEGQRDQTSLGRSPTPIIDHPIVIDLQTKKAEFLVVSLRETLACETREDIRKVDRHFHVIQRHVFQTSVAVVCPEAKIFIDRRHVPLFAARNPGRSVQQAGRRCQVLKKPDVAPIAIFHVALQPVMTPDKI